jgi:hypothetical protein
VDSVSWDLVAKDVIMVTVDKLKLTGQNLFKDVGVLLYATKLHSYQKRLSLKLKTRPNNF